MSKALTKAQADLDAFKAELEAFLAATPATTAVPTPTPTTPATDALLDALATDLHTMVYGTPAPAVEVPARTVADYIAVATATIPEPTATIPEPEPRYIVRMPVTAPPARLGKRMKSAFMEGYRSTAR